MCRARSRAPRVLVGIESQLEAGDERAVAAHLVEREEELRQLQQECAAREAACEVRAAAAADQAEAAAQRAETAEAAAQRAERALAKASAKLGAAVQQNEALMTHLSEASGRELVLRQELSVAQDKAATEAFRLRTRLKEAEFRLQEARRRLAALQLSSKGLTLDQAQSILQGEDNPVAQVLVTRNAELALAERRLEEAGAQVQAARDEGARKLEALERRHRCELAKQAEERERLRRRELQLEYERDSALRRTQELESVLLALEGGEPGRQGAAGRQGFTAGAAGSISGHQRQPGPVARAGATTSGAGALEPCLQGSWSIASSTGAPVSSNHTAAMADHGPQQQQHQQQQPDAEEHAAAYQASDGDGLPEVEEQLAPSPQLRPVTFLQAGPGPGAGSEAPSFLGLGRPGVVSGWAGGAEGALVRQGPDGRGGQRKQVADQVRAGPGGAKQLKLSSFFGGGGSKAVR
ncbi:hypothetical protein MNEG_8250 [Monoraphidium neglectum]|uniref:Uncharacterized protein n=1 Tax=Monoraphidium neglectum TaxID=145388 RepID=A0A0D2JKD6_9CHLO|nr:hypothetical protein MNEG_8250 [Monoraphidium neglectum]KIY99712.1 hypothetical protein MNEG_8250 [Monoraphidium neglectum]|eukprot:XP_013898732.1 hypothetical protein MNEG_8250 [Monoraphidium neglectum]